MTSPRSRHSCWRRSAADECTAARVVRIGRVCRGAGGAHRVLCRYFAADRTVAANLALVGNRNTSWLHLPLALSMIWIPGILINRGIGSEKEHSFGIIIIPFLFDIFNFFLKSFFIHQ